MTVGMLIDFVRYIFETDRGSALGQEIPKNRYAKVIAIEDNNGRLLDIKSYNFHFYSKTALLINDLGEYFAIPYKSSVGLTGIAVDLGFTKKQYNGLINLEYGQNYVYTEKEGGTIDILPTDITFSNDTLKSYEDNKDRLRNIFKMSDLYFNEKEFYPVGRIQVRSILNKDHVERVFEKALSVGDSGAGILRLVDVPRLEVDKSVLTEWVDVSGLERMINLCKRVGDARMVEEKIEKLRNEISDAYMKMSKNEVGYSLVALMKELPSGYEGIEGRLLHGIGYYVFMNSKIGSCYNVEEFTSKHDVTSAYEFVKKNFKASQTIENLRYFSKLNEEYYALLASCDEDIAFLNGAVDELKEIVSEFKVSLTDSCVGYVEPVVEGTADNGLSLDNFVDYVKKDKTLMRNVMIEDLVVAYELSVTSGNNFRIDEIESRLRGIVEQEQVSSKDPVVGSAEYSINKTLDTLDRLLT